MKKYFLIVLAFLFVGMSHAQIKFEKGYIIKENNSEKIDVLIKNKDWRLNPTTFEYKTSETSKIQLGKLESILEFGIFGKSKYERFTVEIDRSSGQLSKISNERRPEFKTEQLFLKVLVEGKADLFMYEGQDVTRFFFRLDNGEVKQLIYKKYMVSSFQTSENNRYRQQLLNQVSCGEMTEKDFIGLDYFKNDLSNHFKKYNECQNITYTSYVEKRAFAEKFNLSIRPGVGLSALKYSNAKDDRYDVEFDQGLAFRLGLEAEFVLPFNKDKWSVFIEPTYQHYKQEKTTYPDFTFLEPETETSIDYSSIELPVGVRYYIFLGEKSKLYLNMAFLVADFQFNSSFTIKNQIYGKSLKVAAGNNLLYGVGYKYNDRFSFEVRNGTNRNLLSNYVNNVADYKSLSFIVGYTFF